MSSEERPQFSDDPFKRLFDSYKNRVYGYVMAITHSPYSAEQIAQEIFIKLCLCRDLLHGSGPIPQQEIILNPSLKQNNGY